MAEQIKDSGNRRAFESGAVRDMAIGKGRCDLLPLEEVYNFLYNPANYRGEELLEIANFMKTGSSEFLYKALWQFSNKYFGKPYVYATDDEDYQQAKQITSILEVSIHYEMGCLKYGEHNWEKGIPLHSFIDSAIRHYLKFLRGDDDERHDRAFVWNILGAIWTINHKPDCIDIDSVIERHTT